MGLIALAGLGCDDPVTPSEDGDLEEPEIVAVRYSGLAAGLRRSCGIEAVTGRVYCWGANYRGQLGDGTDTSPRTIPVAVEPAAGGSPPFAQTMVDGSHHTCALDESNRGIYCWGSNRWAQFGDGSRDSSLTPTRAGLGGVDVLSFDQLAGGAAFTCGLDRTDGQAYCWGSNDFGEVGNGEVPTPGEFLTQVVPAAVRQGGIPFDQIVADNGHACGLDRSTGEVHCWGSNFYGQLGDGTARVRRRTPVSVDQSVLGDAALDELTAGEFHTCGLDADTGQAYCWGLSQFGQVGDGVSPTERHTPVAVEQNGISFGQISAGTNHTCGLDTNSGQAYCWGHNGQGQIGNGTTSRVEPTPTAVDQSVLGGIRFDRISAGELHTCGLDASTGRAYCWGHNRDGQLGDGTTTTRLIPTLVAGSGGA